MRRNLIKIRSCTTFKWFNWFDGLCIELFKFYEEEEEEEEEKEKQKKKIEEEEEQEEEEEEEEKEKEWSPLTLFLY